LSKIIKFAPRWKLEPETARVVTQHFLVDQLQGVLRVGIWDRCYDLNDLCKYFLQKNRRKNYFFTQNKAKLCKNLIMIFFFEKNANFFAENCRKSQKIVIITSTPASNVYRPIGRWSNQNWNFSTLVARLKHLVVQELGRCTEKNFCFVVVVFTDEGNRVLLLGAVAEEQLGDDGGHYDGGGTDNQRKSLAIGFQHWIT
jgi:hypothetical protein